MRGRTFLAFTFFLLLAAGTSSAQAPAVKFYPVGPPILCKGCGHARTDYWRVKFRLQNLSDSNIVVYGRVFDARFDFISDFQNRNPHVCEWQYGFGESERRVQWKDLPSSEKVPIVLKSGEFIESEGGIGGFYESYRVTRVTAFVAQSLATETFEIGSTPYIAFSESTGGETFGYRIVADECTPLCMIGAGSSPNVNGIRLGMSLAEFQTRFPKVEIHRLHKKVVSFKVAYIWGWKQDEKWDQDAYDVDVSFLDDKVARIEALIRSLNGKRRDPDFFNLVAKKIQLPFWPPYGPGWECKDFKVDVLTNEQPTITIQTKAFIKVQAMLAERDIKKRK